jgi:SAM-dependent methyltransferase
MQPTPDRAGARQDFPRPQRASYVHLDIGSFSDPHGADYGIDLEKHPTFPSSTRFLQCNLGFQRLPFPDESIDFVSALDVLEHIPKALWFPSDSLNDVDYEIFSSSAATHIRGMTIARPVVFLFNELYRVMRRNGVFLSVTPAYDANRQVPIAVHQDPTHVSVWCPASFTQYFCPPNLEVPDAFGQQLRYGIRTAFRALPVESRCPYPLPTVWRSEWYFAGFERVYDGSHLTMILEKPDYHGRDVQFFESAQSQLSLVRSQLA